jgi:hypothetical protein
MSIVSIANSEPKYLGCKVGHEEYYFLSVKEGKGRFLKYVAYPMWCRSSDVSDLLDISKPVADEVIAEVYSFILGNLKIEVLPKKRGRSEKVIKTNLNLGTNNNDNNIKGPGRDSIPITSEPPGNGRSGSTDVSIRIENRLSEPGRGSNNLPQNSGKSNVKGTDGVLPATGVQRPINNGKTKNSSDVREKSVPVVATSAPPVVVVEKQKRVRRTKLQMEEARRAEALAQVPTVVKPVGIKGKQNK